MEELAFGYSLNDMVWSMTIATPSATTTPDTVVGYAVTDERNGHMLWEIRYGEPDYPHVYYPMRLLPLGQRDHAIWLAVHKYDSLEG